MDRNTHEEWFVGVIQQFRWDEDGENARYYNALSWYPGKSISDRYCKSEEEARKVLNHAYKQWNGQKVYGSDGKRYETHEAAPGIGVSVVLDKEQDARMRIVKHVIKKRIVTEWETVEKD